MALGAITALTLIEFRLAHVNSLTAGFGYLVAILLTAAYAGATEAVVASFFSVACLNFYFLPPVFTFTIADPQNWVALLAFLVTALVASRLANQARKQTQAALESKQEMDLLYSLSKAILLAEPGREMVNGITADIARIFDFASVVLFDARTERMFASGRMEAEAEHDLRESAINGTSRDHEPSGMHIVSVRLGGQPIGSMAVKPRRISETALQSLANLVAITLERVRVFEESSRLPARSAGPSAR